METFGNIFSCEKLRIFFYKIFVIIFRYNFESFIKLFVTIGLNGNVWKHFLGKSCEQNVN